MSGDRSGVREWRETTGTRAWWFVVSAVCFTAGGSVSGAMGEVVGEAWGGAFLHQLGHALGAVVLVALLSLGGWAVLRRRVSWAGRWALAGALGALVGLAVYVPILAVAPSRFAGLTIMLSFLLPVPLAVVFQGLALRGRMPSPWRWALAWFLAVMAGALVGWVAVGGVEGVATTLLYPVFEQAAAYAWRMVPSSLLGGVVFAALSAVALPLGGRPDRARSRPRPGL